MPIRIVDKKKIDLTEDEFKIYNALCQEYTTPQHKGEDYFIDLFQTDDNGLIIFLTPPKHRISIEIYLFLVSVMVQQHLRAMHKQVDDVCVQTINKLKEFQK